MLWPIKIIVKLLIAHLPVPYRVWQRLGVFRHGQMDRAAYVHKIFALHTDRIYPGGLPPGAALLELGPGDSLASCLLARARQAGPIYHVDVGDFATHDLATYRRMAKSWRAQGLDVPDLDTCQTTADMLALCRARYLTDGIHDLRGIPNQTIDLSWSHSVLEHVRRRDFLPLMQELKRVTKPGGYSSHLVDLQDHLDHGLNNLRFPEKLWEAEWFARAGFYTNRLQADEMIEIARAAGFEIVSHVFGRWPALPLARRKMARPFRDKPEEALTIRTLSLILRA